MQQERPPRSGGLVRLEWQTRPVGVRPIRRSLEVVRRRLAPAFQAIDQEDLAESGYIERDPSGWGRLVAFAYRPGADDIVRMVDRRVDVLETDLNLALDAEGDPALRSDAGEWRIGMTVATRIALDLLGSSEYEEICRALVRVGCNNRRDSLALDEILRANSAHYNHLPDPEFFWRLAERPSPDGKEDGLHVLYSVALGLDWFEGSRPDAIETLIGMPAEGASDRDCDPHVQIR